MSNVRLVLQRLKLEGVFLQHGIKVWPRENELTFLAGEYVTRIALGITDDGDVYLVGHLLIGEIVPTRELEEFVRSKNDSIHPYVIEINECGGVLINWLHSFEDEINPKLVLAATFHAADLALSLDSTLTEEFFLKHVDRFGSTILSH